MTADCRDDKDIQKQFRRQNAVGNMLVRKFSFAMNATDSSLAFAMKFSSLAFAMNATDHINVVFRKFAYSLMSRVNASSNSIVTAIVNSDAYHQSPLMDKWESMLYVQD